jgi:hypothetical protein
MASRSEQPFPLPETSNSSVVVVTSITKRNAVGADETRPGKANRNNELLVSKILGKGGLNNSLALCFDYVCTPGGVVPVQAQSISTQALSGGVYQLTMVHKRIYLPEVLNIQ